MSTPAPVSRPPLLERISDYVRYYAAHRPDAEAWVVCDRRCTYAELDRQVDALARALLAAGIGRGDRVATLATPHPDYWTIFLATASIGAIWVGLNPRYRLEEYRYVAGDSEPSILLARTRIGERDYAADLATLQAEVPSIRRLVVLGGDPVPSGALSLADFVKAGEPVPAAALAERRAVVGTDDPALIVYTSGSTGRPKGALLSHHGLARCCRNQLDYWRAEPVRVQNFLPINHIGCVGDISSWALVAGGCIVFLEKFDAADSLAQIQRERCTVWGGVPTTILMCLSLPDFERYDLSSVQLIVWSGAAAPADLIRRLAQICPRLSNSYGLTETVGSVTFAGPCEDVELLAESVGYPVRDYDFRLADSAGVPVSRGEPGEIQVRGRFIMRGYWRRPHETAEAIDADGWLHTGDLAVERPDGSLRLVGRLKEMYKSGGYNVYPREIEQALESCPGVAMAAVVGVPDVTFGEVGVAFVLREPGVEVAVATLEAWCRERLANYKIPKRFVIADELPLLPIGKLDKQRLLQLANAGSGP
jgi:acyl-CoA synthetase (AMP-forming)/AMP-acid ligase II